MPEIEPTKNLFPVSPQLAADTFARILSETFEQPAWRSVADQEADYYDGNQLDSDALTKLQELGIAPAVENLIAPAIDDILGMEAKNRTDFKVIPGGDIHDQESELVARALGYRLNKAERASGADQACADAYAAMIKVGMGWVEVSRNRDPMKFPYRCQYVHRNEIFWDWLAKEPDLSDARWLLRRRWTDIDVVATMFPGKKRVIEEAGRNHWGSMDDMSMLLTEGGTDTGLAQAWEIERGFSVEDIEWRMPDIRRVCLFELLTRTWEPGLVLKFPGGRVVEYDDTNEDHQLAVFLGIPLEKALLTRVWKSFLMGPHLLHAAPSEFPAFNYVPVWGKREDRTNAPYGVIRNLKYLQDEVNSRIAKMQWLLGAKRTIRTKGAVQMSDDVLRHEVARPDADIVLDREHMSAAGATFEIQDDMALNKQQYERLADLRESMKHISGVSDAFSGDTRGNLSGAGINSLIEQTVQSLARMNDNYAYARSLVGDRLLTMIINDMGSEPQQVMLYADNPLRDTVNVTLNAPYLDEVTGRQLLSNDVQRTKLKVELEDVPSTPSFRRQALVSLSEAFKAAGPEHQQVMLPHLMHLTDVPDKDAIVEAILKINQNMHLTEEQVAERVAAAIEDAKIKWMLDQKNRELDLKEREIEAKIKKTVNEAVQVAIESIYSGVQTGAQIVAMPGAAAAADQVLNSAGFEDQDGQPIVAEPGAVIGSGSGPPPPVRKNTSPGFPPRSQEPGPSPAVGLKTGIEKAGVQAPEGQGV